jgi:hypothetical protein
MIRKALIVNGLVTSYAGEEPLVARQMLPRVYVLNGTYITHRKII